VSEFTPEKQDAILAKVRKLLERADHPNTPPGEADSAREMAESLMLKYRISEAVAVSSGEAPSIVPQWREVRLFTTDSEFSAFYFNLVGAVAAHIGARHVTKWTQDEDGKAWATLNWVGYATDLSYGDMLLTAAMLEFSKRLEPKYNPGLSDEENAWMLRNAGWERKRIAKVMFGDWTTENEMKAKNRKVTNLIKKHAEKIGEDADHLLGRGVNVKLYRESYAQGFVNTFSSRLFRMRTAAGEEGSGTLVLVSRKENVDEAFYTKFPQYRPKPEDLRPYEDPTKTCEKCKKAKSGYCRDHGYLRPTKGRVRYANMAGYNRGGAAAASVDLGPGAAGRGRMGSGGNHTAIG
jgi:hypothetical protein